MISGRTRKAGFIVPLPPMIEYVAIVPQAVRAHLGCLIDEKRVVQRLIECMQMALAQERLDSAARPSLILQELEHAEELLGRIEKRYEVLENMLESYNAVRRNNTASIEEIRRLVNQSTS